MCRWQITLVAFRIVGPDTQVLTKLSAPVAQILRDMPGTRDVDDPLAINRIDLDLGVNPAKSNLPNVTSEAIRRTVRLAHCDASNVFADCSEVVA